jgi:DNA-binding GntR family transcriptional regulator
MAPDPVTQERIYEAIKGDFLAGGMQAGVRLEIQAIADRHRASTTPVREVLHRLVGERLIESRPEGGFRIAIPSVAGLRDLYAWNSRLVIAAVRIAPVAALPDVLRDFRFRDFPQDPVRRASFASALFLSIAKTSKNSECVSAIESANERLHYLRIGEDQLFDDLADEFGSLAGNGYVAVRRVIVKRIKRYHNRRLRRAEELVEIIHRLSSP